MVHRSFASVAEQAIPGDAVRAHQLSLRLLIAARNAARVTLGCMHVGAAPIEPALSCSVVLSAVIRTALVFAVRSHRSSNRVHPRVPREH
jgi:hypothetical protein